MGWATVRRLLALSAFIAIAGIGVLGFRQGRKEASLEKQSERPVNLPLRVASVGGVQEIRFSDQDVQASGIVITAIREKIPKDAVVWSDGKPWVFVETAPLRFRKTALAIRNFENGAYAAEGVPPGSRIVTEGAQVLLSEEQRGSVQVGEEDE